METHTMFIGKYLTVNTLDEIKLYRDGCTHFVIDPRGDEKLRLEIVEYFKSAMVSFEIRELSSQSSFQA